MSEGPLSACRRRPSDTAAVHAAEIVLGAAVAVEVASFEDIATVLGEQLGGEEMATTESGAAGARADDDIESLRDLASGAPVVRAVNDMLEKAMELRPAIFISNRSGTVS